MPAVPRFSPVGWAQEDPMPKIVRCSCLALCGQALIFFRPRRPPPFNELVTDPLGRFPLQAPPNPTSPSRSSTRLTASSPPCGSAAATSTKRSPSRSTPRVTSSSRAKRHLRTSLCAIPSSPPPALPGPSVSSPASIPVPAGFSPPPAWAVTAPPHAKRWPPIKQRPPTPLAFERPFAGRFLPDAFCEDRSLHCLLRRHTVRLRQEALARSGRSLRCHPPRRRDRALS